MPTDPEPVSPPRISARLDIAFHVGLVLKALDGVLETVGGIVLLFVSPASINHFVKWATAHELAQDPNDFIARHLLHSANMLTNSSTLYGAVYLLVHGLTKLVLIIFVLKDKLWAYPWLIAVLGAFILYQAYRLTQKPSAALTALTVFDMAIVLLTWREYQAKARARATATAAAPAVSG